MPTGVRPRRSRAGYVATVSADEFELCFLANRDDVIRLLTVTTGNRERAVDATQEAFIRAHARWDVVRTYDSPGAWVRRIAINVSNDEFKSEQRRHKRERTVHAASSPSPADAVVGDAFAKALLERLPRRQREAAALYYVDDRTISEIASILDTSEGAVKSNLAGARDRLRTVIADDQLDRD